MIGIRGTNNVQKNNQITYIYGGPKKKHEAIFLTSIHGSFSGHHTLKFSIK